MAAPTIVQSDSKKTSSNVTSFTIGDGAGWSAATEGNLICVAIMRDNAGGTISAPDGTWTQVFHTSAGSGSAGVHASYWEKVAGASEPSGGYTFTATFAETWAVAIWELNGGADDVERDVISTDNTGFSSTCDPPSATPTVDDTRIFCGGMWDRRNYSGPAMANYTLLEQQDQSGGIAVFHRTLGTAAAEDPGTFAISDIDDWVSFTAVYKSVAAGAAGYPSQYYDGTIAGNNPGVM